VTAGSEIVGEIFPGRNPQGIGLGDGMVVEIIVAVRSVFRVHENKFDEVREHFVVLECPLVC
jgi:hypothetical protein